MTNKVWMLNNTYTLVYGGDWKDAESSIRAKVFGHMVELAHNRVKFYLSDLFHDAIWLKEEMTGPMSFEWITRESGTHIGEVCKYVKDDDYSDVSRYRFEVLGDDRNRWILNIYESKEDLTIPWMDRHAALDISECDVAKAIEGCIFHPAPLGGWNKEDNKSDTVQSEPGSALWIQNPEPVHEDLGAKYRDEMQKDIVVNEIIDLLFTRPESELPLTLEEKLKEASDKFPTLGNIERKENKMDDIIRDLREKYSEASNSKDQLEEYQSNIGEAVDELDTYMSDLDDLISNLDQLPEISVYVDLDTVSFDS